MFLWNIAVTSLVEVWIEMEMNKEQLAEYASLPLWKCGLKSLLPKRLPDLTTVTSLVEVWIEINCLFWKSDRSPSLPLWKCGLKYINRRYLYLLYPVTSLVEVWIEMMPSCSICSRCVVTSLVEVWIEIKVEQSMVKEKHCHFPCGSVD